MVGDPTNPAGVPSDIGHPMPRMDTSPVFHNMIFTPRDLTVDRAAPVLETWSPRMAVTMLQSVHTTASSVTRVHPVGFRRIFQSHWSLTVEWVASPARQTRHKTDHLQPRGQHERFTALTINDRTS